MAHSTFKGGIFPHRRKRFTREEELIEYIPKGDLVYPLLQHVGGAAVPVVEPGDRVLEGQVIARADGDISVPLHASVSGTVKAIEPRMAVSGREVLSIVVENDGLYEKEPVPAPPSWKGLEPGERIRRIREAGIVGLGGDGYPTYLKLGTDKKIKLVIVNGTECEPYMTHEYRRLCEEPQAMVEGLQIVLSLFEKAKGLFAVSENMREAATALHQATASERRIGVRVLETRYPQGAERLLVYTCTGKRLDSVGRAQDVGCLVLDVETVYAVYRALVCGQPLTQRALTVTGKALKNPGNYVVRIGTSFAELADACGGFEKEPKRFVCGGPMRGTAMKELDVPVMKTSTGLLCMSRTYDCKPRTCIRCGRCVEACPMRLMPGKLADLANAGKEDDFVKFGGMECISCGSCTYTCPARRELTSAVSTMRKALLAQGKRY